MKTSKLFVALLLIANVSCKNNEDLSGDNFIGSYDMYTTIIAENTVMGFDTMYRNVGSYPLEIYKDGKQMYVQTCILGIPNSKTPLESNARQQRLLCLEDTTEEQTELIPIVDTTSCKIFLRNGIMYSTSYGVYRKPHPIPVQQINPYSLTFSNSDIISVPLVVSNGLGDDYTYATADCYYQYGDLQYSNACFTWDVELKFQNQKELDSIKVETKRIIYHNIITRKQ